MNQGYISQQEQQAIKEQRLERFQKLGYKPTPGVITEEHANGTFHDPRVRQVFSDVLIGGKYKGMFRNESRKNANKDNLEKLPGVVNTGTEKFKEIESMFSDDRRYSSTANNNGQFNPISIDSINTPDFGGLLKKRLEEKQYKQQQSQNNFQQPYQQKQRQGGLSYSEFALDKDGFQNEHVEDFNAYQQHNFSLNEQFIRSIAQEIAEETIKSVLSEHIKNERKKYVFEKVEGKNPKTGKKYELLKKDDKYYTLKTISTEQGDVVALQEISVKSKKKK